MAYTADHIADLDVSTPAGTESGDKLADALKEIKRAVKNDFTSSSDYASITPASSITITSGTYPKVVILPTTADVTIATINTDHATDSPYVVDFLITGSYTITFSGSGNIKFDAIGFTSIARKEQCVRMIKYGSYWYPVIYGDLP